jgi:hypothetical protein
MNILNSDENSPLPLAPSPADAAFGGGAGCGSGEPTAEQILQRDEREAKVARRKRFVVLAGRSPIDLEAISDLWLD